MQRTQINELKSKIEKRVKIAGFLQTLRDQGNIKFLIIRDISGLVQAVLIKSKDNPNLFNLKPHPESVIEIIGRVKSEPQAINELEIHIEDMKVLSSNENALPIPIVDKGNEESDQQIRLDWRWLDLRKPEKALIFKVWTTMEHAFRSYCIDNGFIEIHSPKITASATESGSELFKIKYFDKEAHLAQSPQLYKQMAMAGGFEKVFEVGPVFRANPSFTSRHDTEFTMYDIEISYIDSHHDLMNLEEDMIISMLKSVKQKYANQISEHYNREIIVPSKPFPRLTLKEAKEILKKLGVPNERGDDMSPEEERQISQYIKDKTGFEFVFIHEFPVSVRPFYTMLKDDDQTVTKSFDLIWNGIEITSGAQREHRVDLLENQIKAKGLKIDSFENYLNFFRFGCPPHGGFAPGPTRMLMKLLDIPNVREVTYLYRGVKRITP